MHSFGKLQSCNIQLSKPVRSFSVVQMVQKLLSFEWHQPKIAPRGFHPFLHSRPNNFWTSNLTEKLCTVLESYSTQLYKTMQGFFLYCERFKRYWLLKQTHLTFSIPECYAAGSQGLIWFCQIYWQFFFTDGSVNSRKTIIKLFQNWMEL